MAQVQEIKETAEALKEQVQGTMGYLDTNSLVAPVIEKLRGEASEFHKYIVWLNEPA